ncbi:MAG: LbtU family siderophore porin [Bdellovibrionaceae bacterium]|nr:LbtU family siderophore porin [Pseudobdellovibrionaceae bacterium]
MKTTMTTKLVALTAALIFSASVNAESKVTVEGLVEVELSTTSGDTYDKDAGAKSDIALATAQLGIKAQVNPTLTGTMVLLFEDKGADASTDTNMQWVEEAYLTRKMLDGALEMNLGRKIVPFGTYNTVMVSDPLTLEFGETTENVIQAAYHLKDAGLSFGLYLFNGDKNKTETDGADTVSGNGLFLSHAFKGDSFTVNTNVGMLSNFAETNRSVFTVGTENEVAATAISVDATFGNTSVGFEHMMAGQMENISTFTANAGAAVDATPTATSIEVSHKMDKFTFGVAQQMTAEALALSLPSSKTLLAVGFNKDEGCNITFEYYTATLYATGDATTGPVVAGSDDAKSGMTIQWAANF